jgi:ubiquinone/menaquinone biosynthesis C-methylase UbiE
MLDDSQFERWNRYYRDLAESYLIPNEYVVRAFLGSYPGLKMVRDYKGAKVCDVSCGDGRNLVLLNKLGLELYATEVSSEISELTRRKLQSAAEPVDVEIRVGFNDALPYEDAAFDYMLSWNACYYMRSDTSDIQGHVSEHARVLKPGGYLVMSVPSPGCFSLQGAKVVGDHLIQINTDSKWNMLNGSIYYQFDSKEHVERIFSTEFDQFSFAVLRDDCFGLPLEYFICVCRRRAALAA